MERKNIIIIISVVVLLLCCLASACGLSAFALIATGMRADADSAISKAASKIKKAQLATEKGSNEEKELADAKDLLNEAKTLRNKGSYIDLEPYEKAVSKADYSAKISYRILKRVADLLAEADERGEDEPFSEFVKGYFDLYHRYPRTPEAKKALEMAEAELEVEVVDADPLNKLLTIALFNKLYPKEDKPDSGKDMAREAVIELASTRIEDLKQSQQINQNWCNHMSVERVAEGAIQGEFRNQPIGDAEAYGTQQIINDMPNLYQDANVQRLASLICEGCRLVQQCTTVGASPISKDESSDYYSDEQIATVSGACSQMSPIISEIDKLLKELEEA